MDGIRTIPTSELGDLIVRINHLERIEQAARAVLEYDKAVSTLSEGSDEGALTMATQLFDASFDVLEAALFDYDNAKRS